MEILCSNCRNDLYDDWGVMMMTVSKWNRWSTGVISWDSDHSVVMLPSQRSGVGWVTRPCVEFRYAVLLMTTTAANSRRSVPEMVAFFDFGHYGSAVTRIRSWVYEGGICDACWQQKQELDMSSHRVSHTENRVRSIWVVSAIVFRHRSCNCTMCSGDSKPYQKFNTEVNTISTK